MRLAFALALLTAGAATAQPAGPPPGPVPAVPTAEAPRAPSWFSFGAGASTGGYSGMVSLGVRAFVPAGLGPAVAEAGVTAATEVNLLGPSESVTEVHVAGGIAGRSGPLVVSAVAGPAVARVSRSEPVGSGSRFVSRTYPGVYAGVQAILVPGRTVGLGAEAYGQANAGLSTAGLRLFVAVGGLR